MVTETTITINAASPSLRRRPARTRPPRLHRLARACVVTRRTIAQALPSGATATTQGDTRGIGIRYARPDRGDAFAFVRYYSHRPRLVRVWTSGDCPRVEVTSAPAEAPGLVPWIVSVLELDRNDALPEDHESFDGSGGENLWTTTASDLYRTLRGGGCR